MLTDNSFGIIPLRREAAGWEVLLILHRHGHHWSFPKGHSEEGESPLQTAQRELAEETGLAVISLLVEGHISENYQFRHHGQQIHKTVCYFLAEVSGELQLQEEELSGAKWVPLEQAAGHVTFSEAQELCRKVVAQLQHL
jgi:8-oxo-dGTP pyrophosphatase MutT (NUDIX family)